MLRLYKVALVLCLVMLAYVGLHNVTYAQEEIVPQHTKAQKASSMKVLFYGKVTSFEALSKQKVSCVSRNAPEITSSGAKVDVVVCFRTDEEANREFERQYGIKAAQGLAGKATDLTPKWCNADAWFALYYHSFYSGWRGDYCTNMTPWSGSTYSIYFDNRNGGDACMAIYNTAGYIGTKWYFCNKSIYHTGSYWGPRIKSFKIWIY